VHKLDEPHPVQDMIPLLCLEVDDRKTTEKWVYLPVLKTKSYNSVLTSYWN